MLTSLLILTLDTEQEHKLKARGVSARKIETIVAVAKVVVT